MIRRLLLSSCFLLVAAGLQAGDRQEEIIWDYLPQVVYLSETMHIHGRLPSAAGDEARLHVDGRMMTALCDDQGAFRFAISVDAAMDQFSLSIDGHEQQLRLVRPGDPVALRVDEGLRDDRQRLVLLVLRRQEATEDRRWQLLRRGGRVRFERKPCSCDVPVPGTVGWGGSALLHQIASIGDIEVRGQAVLLQLGNADIYRGWQHRAYRQVLAWLIADLRKRGAQRIVLVQPPVVDLDRERARPLWQQVFDVARSYDCEVVQVQSLSSKEYWEIQPGVLGHSLNTAGQQALDSLLRDYRADGPGAG